jgi:hypothetical protein
MPRIVSKKVDRLQIWSCGCGLKYTHSNKKKHERTYRHQLYESKKGFIDIESFTKFC